MANIIIRTLADSISSGTSVSTGVDVETKRGSRMFIQILSLNLAGETFDNTTFNIQENIEGSWVDIYDDAGNQLSVNVVDGKVAIPDKYLKGVEQIRLSGGSNETADRSFSWRVLDRKLPK